MADLGDVIGTLMVGLIKARRMADEQTAILAEYYKTNPVLEGLSVPRIRVPELTIEMPVLIEDHQEGQAAQPATPEKIMEAVSTQLKKTLADNKIELQPEFQEILKQEFTRLASTRKQPDEMPFRETSVRDILSAFSKAQSRTRTNLTPVQKEIIARDLRAVVTANAITNEAVPPSVVSNIKTADVKEKATNTTVMRLRITMKEEGLEWTTQPGEAGGTIRTLTPE